MKKYREIPYNAYSRDDAEHREFYHDAGDEYSHPPVRDIDPEQLEPKSALQEIAANYFNKMSPERISKVFMLVEEMRMNSDLEPLKKPDLIVCVPVAAHNETLETISQTLDILSEQDNANNLEIFIYGNYPNTIDDAATFKSHENIRQAVMRARKRHRNLTIRYITVGYEEENMGIGAVRKDMMDAIAADASERGLGYNQPIMWIDADVTGMSKNALQDVAVAIKEGVAFFLHLNPRQTVDGVTADRLSQIDVAAKAAVHYEILRRKAIRHDLQEYGEPSYHEESGLGFMLGNYILIGGVNQGDAVNESFWLMQEFRHYGSKIAAVVNRISGKQNAAEYMSKIKYLPNARIYTSGRRLVANAKMAAEELLSRKFLVLVDRDLGNSYGDFSHTERLREGVEEMSDELSSEEKERLLKRMFGYNMILLRGDRAKATELSKKLIEKLQNTN